MKQRYRLYKRKTAGYPEQFAMENSGQNSKAVHRAYYWREYEHDLDEWED